MTWQEKNFHLPIWRALGHYKADSAPHSHTPDTPEYEEYEDNRQQILNAHLYLLNYAIGHGHSFDRSVGRRQ